MSTSAQAVTDVSTLNEGDTVKLTGNGVDITHDIELAGVDALGDQFASFDDDDGFTFTLKNSGSHPLQTDELCLLAGCGKVRVRRVEA